MSGRGAASGEPSRRGLELVAVGGVGGRLLEHLGPELDRRFGTRAFRGPPLPLREEWLDPERGQYRSSEVVDALLARHVALGAEPSSLWSLGVAAADLGAPGREYVFGEATVGGPCAVVSTARLDPGEGPASARLRARLLGVAVHELGHLAGLGHCPRPGCVMHPVERAEEADARGSDFCSACHARLSARAACPPG